MTIDEAIINFRAKERKLLEQVEKIRNETRKVYFDYGEFEEERANECKQLAQWLEELKLLREENGCDKCETNQWDALYRMEQDTKNKTIDMFIRKCDEHCGYYNGENRNLSRNELLIIAEQIKNS